MSNNREAFDASASSTSATQGSFVKSVFATASPFTAVQNSSAQYSASEAAENELAPAKVPERRVSSKNEEAPFQVVASNAESERSFFLDEHEPSSSQLELKAIFGADRDMAAEEILHRTRSLPGIRHVSRVNEFDVNALDSLKKSLSVLGFGDANFRLYGGSAPVEFVRDGQVLLAVQTNGGFAPGVREILKIVARELRKMN
jgi:hypothetical protein